MKLWKPSHTGLSHDSDVSSCLFCLMFWCLSWRSWCHIRICFYVCVKQSDFIKYRFLSSRVESYITTDGPSASVSSDKAPIWGLRPNFYCRQTVSDLLIWGAFSDERTGLSFAITAHPRQRSHSWVRVAWDSRPYFTASDSRISFLSPPTTRRVTVEVFDPASTRGEPKRHHRLEQFVCYYLFPPLLRNIYRTVVLQWTVRCHGNVCYFRGEPLSSSGPFRLSGVISR
jgi:hypothetical protein